MEVRPRLTSDDEYMKGFKSGQFYGAFLFFSGLVIGMGTTLAIMLAKNV